MSGQKRKPASPHPLPPAPQPSGFIRPRLPDEQPRANPKSAPGKAEQPKAPGASKPIKLAPTPVQPCIPPDAVPLPLPSGPTVLRLGPGLAPADPPVVTRAGMLFRALASENSKAGRTQVEKWHVERLATRCYVPAPGDPVLLTVLSRGPFGAEAYLCTHVPGVGAAPGILLPYLGFENATRRNRPDLKPGDLVYARMVSPTSAECLAADGKGGGYGVLRGGMSVKVSAGICRKLLSPGHALLPALGRYAQFEVAIGANGLVWISAGSAKDAILASKCIGELGGKEMDAEGAGKLVGKFVADLRARLGAAAAEDMDIDVDMDNNEDDGGEEDGLEEE